MQIPVQPLSRSELGIIMIAILLGMRIVFVDFFLPFLKPLLDRRNGKTPHVANAGEMDVDFWRREMREASAATFRTSVLPVLQQQTEILNELKIAVATLTAIQQQQVQAQVIKDTVAAAAAASSGAPHNHGA